MAKKSMILKQQAEPKFSSRRYNRCKICGRPHAYLRVTKIRSVPGRWLCFGRAHSPDTPGSFTGLARNFY